jgi:hypothetical protein
MQFRRNSGCRFDHRVWRIEPLRCRLGEMRLKDLTAHGPASVPGHKFARRRVCAVCGRSDSRFRLERVAPEMCCGRAMVAPGFDVVEMLDGELPPQLLEMPLNEVGLTYGDVLEVDGRDVELIPDVVMEEAK